MFRFYRRCRPRPTHTFYAHLCGHMETLVALTHTDTWRQGLKLCLHAHASASVSVSVSASASAMTVSMHPQHHPQTIRKPVNTGICVGLHPVSIIPSTVCSPAMSKLRKLLEMEEEEDDDALFVALAMVATSRKKKHQLDHFI